VCQGPVNGAWSGYNGPVPSRAIVLSLVVVALAGCPGRGATPQTDDAGGRAATEPAVERDAPEPHPLPPDAEEQQRRAEAVRRAAEELVTRGVDTREYLINLIVEGDVYRVSFVRRTGATLDREMSVRVRRQNFEILSVEP